MSSSDTTEYTKLLEAGHDTVLRMVAQAHNMAVTSTYEERALSQKQDQKWPASPFTLSALRTSAGLMQFMTFEAIANFMAAIAVGVSDGVPGAPNSARSLHAAERDFLLEQVTELNPRTGEVITRNGAFATSLDRLTTTPRLLGAIVGVDCKVEKGGEGWQRVRDLKELRDGWTHPRIHTRAEPTSVNVFRGGEALYWYLNQLEPLLIRVRASPQAWLTTTWLTLDHLRASAGYAQKQFDKRYPKPAALSFQSDAESSTTEAVEQPGARPSSSTPDLEQAVVEAIEARARHIVEQWKQKSAEAVEDYRTTKLAFESELAAQWQEPFFLFDLYLAAVYDCFASLVKEVEDESDPQIEALVRLHGTAFKVASEIRTLILSGHADGAHGRWRTLFELEVVASIIATASKETAERFLEHDAISARTFSENYQKAVERLGWEPIANEEIQSLEGEFQALKERFGQQYSGRYGWAANAVKDAVPSHTGPIGIQELAKIAGVDYLWPYYDLANLFVHASARSVSYSLGSNDDSNELLCGPAQSGFADPADSTVLSLLRTTASLLSLRENAETLAQVEALRLLREQVAEAFHRVQRSLAHDDGPSA